ncbi:hypothetical protein [Haloglomus litoreum]|uniref:hypothetical protein n=1 Tax=Haloglomus litoreum TaxID=3034026 RepID=UPI0023E86A6F|nr:hypothetical protein [Haloglomus sp. DT116]
MDEPSTDPSDSDGRDGRPGDDAGRSLTGDEQYAVVRRAVEDALWSVLGTAVYAVFLAVLFVVGLSMLAGGLFAADQPGGLTLLLVGVVLFGGAGLELVRTFGLFPSVRRRSTTGQE